MTLAGDLNVTYPVCGRKSVHTEEIIYNRFENPAGLVNRLNVTRTKMAELSRFIAFVNVTTCISSAGFIRFGK